MACSCYGSKIWLVGRWMNWAPKCLIESREKNVQAGLTIAVTYWDVTWLFCFVCANLPNYHVLTLLIGFHFSSFHNQRRLNMTSVKSSTVLARCVSTPVVSFTGRETIGVDILHDDKHSPFLIATVHLLTTIWCSVTSTNPIVYLFIQLLQQYSCGTSHPKEAI